MGITSYERKTRFLLSDQELSIHSNKTIKPTQIYYLVSLTKLPDELQALVHKERLGVYKYFQTKGQTFTSKKLAMKLQTIANKVSQAKKKITFNVTQKLLLKI